MGMAYAVIYAIIAIVSIAVYFVKYRLSYWRKRGVPHDEPDFLYGSMKGVPRVKHFTKPVGKAYNKYKGVAPFCGLYSYLNPIVVPTDLQLVKQILVKDFTNFVDRGVFHNERDDPLTGHLFALDGSKWRRMRTKLTPTFTSGKMKFMFPTVVDVGHRFAEVFGEMVAGGSVIEIKEVLARFTTDVIGTCAFGIECNSLRDPNAEFRTIGQKFFTTRRHGTFIYTLIRANPDLAKRLRLRTFTNDVHNFFMRVVRETVEFREKNNIVRNDFMNMLIELKNNKSTKTESGEVITGLTMEELAAQAFVFYVGGFETSSSAMGFALYELAQHQEIQDKLRREINEVFAKHNGKLTYECMKDMKYMDQVIYETLRKYPILSILNRRAKEDYVIDAKYKIEKGTHVYIPVRAIHYDPDIYPDPKKFDPERFSAEQMEKRDPIAWLPFGEGPRNCIGLRFGKMQTRIGLSLLLKNFKFEVCAQTEIPLQYNTKVSLLATKGGIHLRVNPI